MSNINYNMLPEHMQDSMRGYVERGERPGTFLLFILAHKIYEAAGHADEINLVNLHTYIKFMYNYLPLMMHGDEHTVEKYLTWKQEEVRNGR